MTYRLFTAAVVVAASALAAACERATPISSVRASVAARPGSDSAMVTARWTSTDAGVVFLWRSSPASGDESFERADTAVIAKATFAVPRPSADTRSEFCVRTLRLSDGKKSGETCAEYVLSAQPPPLPDSGEVHIALVHQTMQYGPRDTLSCLTLRWDSVPGATRFALELRRHGRLLSRSNVNDDSCPACDELGLEGDRWPCYDSQAGCGFNVWPYFSAAWCVPVRSERQTLEATLTPLRRGEALAPSHVVEWTVPAWPDRR